MPKSEHSVYRTPLETRQIRAVIASVLDSATTIEDLNMGPLDEPAEIAILATRRNSIFNKSPFGGTNAVAQIVVVDEGNFRTVELIAVAHTFMESFNVQRAAGTAGAGFSAAMRAPDIKAGRRMVAALADALRRAEPSTQQVG